MMVLTAVHMLSFVDNASGEDVSVGSAVDRPTTHSQRRLTISNIGAKEPSSMTDSDGNLYLAWVDITEHGEVLCWKRSSDNARSFTSDKAISSEFLSIRNISMTFIEATDEVVIAFEGKMDETGPFMVYLLMSQNGQRSWSQLYALGEGAGPTVLAIDRDLFISLTSLEQGRNVFSIIKASIIDSRLQGATSIISFPVDAKVGEMVSLGDRIHYASFVRDGTDSFVYGQIDRLGNRLIGPSAVLKTGMEINEFVLMDDQGVPTLVWLGKEYERTYLKAASMKGDIWGSISETPLVGMAHDLVSASSENGKYISWISSDGEKDNVFGARKDGPSTNEQSRISSPGFNASKPTISLGPEGSFNLIWSEDTGNSTELYICADASYEIPNICRLNQWLSEQSVDAFVNGDEGRQALISNISSIIQNISTDNLVESTEKIWEVENNIDHYIIGLSVLNAGSDTMSKALSVKAKLKANLESVRTGIANGGNADSLLSSESMDGGSPESYIYDVLVTLLSPTSVKISWSTSFYAVHNRISIGATSPYDTEYDVSGNGYEHERTIDVQSNTEYQFFVKSCELYLLVLHTPYSSSVMSFKTNVTILNVAGSSELFSIQLAWQTTVSSICTIQLDAPDQPVLSGSVSSDSSRTAVACLTIDLFAMIASGASYVSELIKVTGKASVGIVLGFIGCVLSFVSFVASAAEDLVADLITSTCGVLLGIISIFCGVFDMVKTNLGMKTFAGFSLLLGVFSTTLSSCSIFGTINKLENQS